MINIVTVTCSRDINQMILQAHSINVFAKTQVTHHVFIEDTSISRDEWLRVLSPHYFGIISFKLYYNILPAGILTNDGWSRQQILKLESGKHVNGDYLILDSKNFLIKPTSFNYTLKEGCYRRVPFNGIYPVLQPFVGFAARELKREFPKNFYIAHTPFKVLKQNIDKLLGRVNVRELFTKAVANGNRPTEFTLYSFFGDPELINMEQSLWDSTYNVNNINYHTWWWVKDFNIDELDSIYSSSVEFLGVHKNVWAERTVDMHKFANWLVSKGLNRTHVLNATVFMSWGDTPLIKE